MMLLSFVGPAVRRVSPCAVLLSNSTSAAPPDHYCCTQGSHAKPTLLLYHGTPTHQSWANLQCEGECCVMRSCTYSLSNRILCHWIACCMALQAGLPPQVYKCANPDPDSDPGTDSNSVSLLPLVLTLTPAGAVRLGPVAGPGVAADQRGVLRHDAGRQLLGRHRRRLGPPPGLCGHRALRLRLRHPQRPVAQLLGAIRAVT